MNKERRQMNHRRLLAILASAAAILASAAGAGPAQADFGLSEFDVQFNAEDATPAKPADDPMQTQAGSHPFAFDDDVRNQLHRNRPSRMVARRGDQGPDHRSGGRSLR